MVICLFLVGLLNVVCIKFTVQRSCCGSGSQSPASHRRNSGSMSGQYVRFLVDKLALVQVFLGILRVSPVSILPPVLHTHLPLRVALARPTNGRSAGFSFENRGELDRKALSFYCASEG